MARGERDVPSVEFLGDFGPDLAPTEELLDDGPPLPRRRWLWMLVVVAVGVAMVTAVVTGRGEAPDAVPETATPVIPTSFRGLPANQSTDPAESDPFCPAGYVCTEQAGGGNTAALRQVLRSHLPGVRNVRSTTRISLNPTTGNVRLTDRTVQASMTGGSIFVLVRPADRNERLVLPGSGDTAFRAFHAERDGMAVDVVVRHARTLSKRVADGARDLVEDWRLTLLVP